MSGNLAARYIAGLPYDPSLGVSAYSRAPRAAAPTGTASLPGGALTLPIDATGQAVRVPAAGATLLGGAPAAAVVGTPTASGVAGGEDGLASALLSGAGLLQYAPDAYNYLFGDTSAVDPAGQGITTLPGGDQISNAVFNGLGTNWDNVFQPGTWSVDEAATQRLLDAPMGELGQGGAEGAAGQGGWFSLPSGAVLSAADDPLTGSLGAAGGLDVATGLAGAGGGALGGWIASQAPWTQQGYGAVGAQAGSALGGVATGALIGSAAGPIGTAAGALAGALLGGWGGGAAGSQIGPLPTIGGNFSSIGTFDGSGGLHWGNSGGDNGGNANDATSFANWFAPNLQQQAAAQGYGFNPNMGGAQIRVGGFDNPSRRGYAPGGYFYDLTNAGGSFGGTPERYALRSSDMFNNAAYSPAQADAFTQNVLADLIARGVYTQGGQPGQDQAYLGSTLGANYGWYGAPGDLYSQIEYGGQGGFNDILQGRQNAVTGYVNEQRQQQAQAAAVANTAFGWAPDTGQTWGAYDLSQPIWAGGGLVNPGDALFPTMAASQAPAEVQFGGYQGGGG